MDCAALQSLGAPLPPRFWRSEAGAGQALCSLWHLGPLLANVAMHSCRPPFPLPHAHTQIELYRDTRESLQAACPGTALRDLIPAARERAFRREMKADNNLHPALQTPDGNYKV